MRLTHLFVEREIGWRIDDIIGGWIRGGFRTSLPVQSVHEIHQSGSFGGQDGDDSEENSGEEDETNEREHLLPASMR